jgi:hypothetical protein
MARGTLHITFLQYPCPQLLLKHRVTKKDRDMASFRRKTSSLFMESGGLFFVFLLLIKRTGMLFAVFNESMRSIKPLNRSGYYHDYKRYGIAES